jgi:hypothetical protein
MPIKETTGRIIVPGILTIMILGSRQEDKIFTTARIFPMNQLCIPVISEYLNFATFSEGLLAVFYVVALSRSLEILTRFFLSPSLQASIKNSAFPFVVFMLFPSKLKSAEMS